MEQLLGSPVLNGTMTGIVDDELPLVDSRYDRSTCDSRLRDGMSDAKVDFMTAYGAGT